MNVPVKRVWKILKRAVKARKGGWLRSDVVGGFALDWAGVHESSVHSVLPCSGTFAKTFSVIIQLNMDTYLGIYIIPLCIYNALLLYILIYMDSKVTWYGLVCHFGFSVFPLPCVYKVTSFAHSLLLALRRYSEAFQHPISQISAPAYKVLHTMRQNKYLNMQRSNMA